MAKTMTADQVGGSSQAPGGYPFADHRHTKKVHMPIEIYNTLTRRKEPFETIDPGIVRMYVCGPTVYDRAHIGHAMSAIVFDTVRRYLEYRGYTVHHVQNFTDVDDKIINRAN